MKTLLLVDLQRDFLPGGALAVPEGDQVIPCANRWMPQYEWVIASKDWHPPGHASFASQHPGRQPGDTIRLDEREQLLWPDHCVQGTPGAEFAPGLQTEGIHQVFLKGCDPRLDSYSALFDNAHRRATGLEAWLRQQGIQEIDVMGLATDYCVRFTVLDALACGFGVRVLAAGCRGIEQQAGDIARAWQAMERAGAEVHFGPDA